MKTKKCSKCGEVKDLGEFSKRKALKDGHRGQCKSCDSAYRKVNKDKGSEYNRKWTRGNKCMHEESIARYKTENRDKIRERDRLYYKKNRELILKKRSVRYFENKDTFRERAYSWRKRNPDKFTAIQERRRARENQATGTFSGDDWRKRLDYYGGKCVYCGSSEKIEVEHRIPLSRGGSNWPANLVPACRSCNSRKGTKTEFEFKALLSKEN